MKLNGVIIHDGKSDTFTGFVKQYPGVCAQADSIDNLQIKLGKYMKLYVQYVDVVMNTDDIINM